MKKIILVLLSITMIFSLIACTDNKSIDTNALAEDESEKQTTEINTNQPETETDEKSTEANTEQKETEPNYAEIVPNELQGVWIDTEISGILSIYAFKDKKVDLFTVTVGISAASMFSGTYTVQKNKLKYNFKSAIGYSDYYYNGDTFVLTNENKAEIKKISATNIMEYIIQEEKSGNKDGVICLADLIINYYPNSDECSAATEKKNTAISEIKAEGEAALNNLRADYDKVQKITWYEHKNQPQYCDICCYIYPYIYTDANGDISLLVRLNYTDAQTNAGWVFYNTVIFSVDGENTTKTFSYYDVIRDNDTEVWEVVDFVPSASEINLLEKIAFSTETIIRFEGSEHYYDHIVTDKEKAAIADVLTAYNYLANYSK